MVASTSKFKYIVCDPELCIGCQLCEYICSYTKTGEFNTYRSRIRTVRVDEVLITAVACRTCENAPCVIACTRDALTQDSETGIIHIDPIKCDGCAWCIEACDLAPSLSTTIQNWQNSAISVRMLKKAPNASRFARRMPWSTPHPINVHNELAIN
jgi:Fe-S-cluster-containing dehydrogenase component